MLFYESKDQATHRRRDTLRCFATPYPSSFHQGLCTLQHRRSALSPADPH